MLIMHSKKHTAFKMKIVRKSYHYRVYHINHITVFGKNLRCTSQCIGNHFRIFFNNITNRYDLNIFNLKHSLDMCSHHGATTNKTKF